MSADLTVYLYELQLKEPWIISNGNRAPLLSTKDGRDVERGLQECLEAATNVSWQRVAPLRAMGKTGYLLSLISPEGSNVVFRYYKSQALLTIDVQGLLYEDSKVMDVANSFDRLIERLMQTFPSDMDGDYVPIPRGGRRPADKIYVSDEQQVFIYDRELCDVDSKFQNIKILHTIPFGNALFLDGQINLAESDLCYTHALMHKNEVNYKDKEVLILGGGDGALLYELLKEQPRFVTMVDIDDMVMTMCAQHMRSCCGNVLDGDRVGPNYRVIVGDCFTYMADFTKQGRRFDFIFGDLTDCPISNDSNDDEENFEEFWQLMEKTLDCSLKLLKPDGRFFTHLIGFGDCRPAQSQIIPTYERMIVNRQAKFVQTMNFVPSFGDKWVYYMVMPKAVQSSKL